VPRQSSKPISKRLSIIIDKRNNVTFSPFDPTLDRGHVTRLIHGLPLNAKSTLRAPSPVDRLRRFVLGSPNNNHFIRHPLLRGHRG
jgi:hypothetical protein